MTVNNYDSIKDKYKVSVYENHKGHKVKFYEMIHIAPKEFYDKRNELINKDINNNYLVFHEGVKNVPTKNIDLMSVYGEVAKSVGWVLQPKPKYPFFQVDADYNKMNLKEKFFLKTLNNTSVLILDALNIMKANKPEEYKEFIEKLKKELVELEDEPVELTNKKLNTLLTPIRNWTKKFMLDSRNTLLVNEVLNENENVVLVWGKAHHKGVRELLTNYNYKLISEEIVD